MAYTTLVSRGYFFRIDTSMVYFISGILRTDLCSQCNGILNFSIDPDNSNPRKLRWMTLSFSVLNSVAHSFRIFLALFFYFPVSCARPEKWCDCLLATTSNHEQVRLDWAREKLKILGS